MPLNYTALLERSRSIMTAIAAGDSLGSTSEMKSHPDVPYLYESLQGTGWPFAQAGGGPLGLKPGDPTDDTEMAICTYLSFRELYHFEPQDVVGRLIAWKRTHPRGIKPGVMTALSWTASSDRWFEGPLHEYTRGALPGFSACLSRNGLAAGMASSLDEAFRFSILQCIMTDFSPEQVICCCAQSFILMELLCGGRPASNWRDSFRLLFTLWLDRERDRAVGAWRETVGEGLAGSLDLLLATDLSVGNWSPLGKSWGNGCDKPLHLFRIALWALHWSLSGDRFPSPHSLLPESLFRQRGNHVLGWVVLAGHHSDAYAAAAAPLLTAVHGALPAGMTQSLKVLRDL
jgi:hypothetical protein